MSLNKEQIKPRASAQGWWTNALRTTLKCVLFTPGEAVEGERPVSLLVLFRNTSQWPEITAKTKGRNNYCPRWFFKVYFTSYLNLMSKIFHLPFHLRVIFVCPPRFPFWALCMNVITFIIMTEVKQCWLLISCYIVVCFYMLQNWIRNWKSTI